MVFSPAFSAPTTKPDGRKGRSPTRVRMTRSGPTLAGFRWMSCQGAGGSGAAGLGASAVLGASSTVAARRGDPAPAAASAIRSSRLLKGLFVLVHVLDVAFVDQYVW